MGNGNIEYNTDEIAAFYSANRRKWDDFYPSERWVFEHLSGDDRNLGTVLDVGCACGGLGAALCERFILQSYTGVEINRQSIAWAEENIELPVPSSFIHGDIVKTDLPDTYDLVASLSCADWNIETGSIIDSCWERVSDGGYFVISLRLTPMEGINDIAKSYQRIDFSGRGVEPEIANYVVFNFKEAMGTFKSLKPTPEIIGAYGYWGKPSTTAVTPYEKLAFAVFYLKKGSCCSDSETAAELNLPIGLFL